MYYPDYYLLPIPSLCILFALCYMVKNITKYIIISSFIAVSIAVWCIEGFENLVKLIVSLSSIIGACFSEKITQTNIYQKSIIHGIHANNVTLNIIYSKDKFDDKIFQGELTGINVNDIIEKYENSTR